MKDINNTNLKISMLKGKHWNSKGYSRYFTVNNIRCPVPTVISIGEGTKTDTMQQQIKSATQNANRLFGSGRHNKNHTMTPIQQNYFTNLTLKWAKQQY